MDIRCRGEVLHAHKSILGARSEVLCGMLEAGAEGSSGVITVSKQSAPSLLWICMSVSMLVVAGRGH